MDDGKYYPNTKHSNSRTSTRFSIQINFVRLYCCSIRCLVLLGGEITIKDLIFTYPECLLTKKSYYLKLKGSILGIYTFLENKWYDFVEWANKFVPIAKVTDAIDKRFPSFLVFLGLFLVVLFLLVFGILSLIQTTPIEYQAEITVSSIFGGPIEGALISIAENCGSEEKSISLKTNNEGKIFFVSCSGEISVLVTKEGFIPYSAFFDLINEFSPKVLLQPKPTLPEKVSVTITDLASAQLERVSLEAYCVEGSNLKKIFGVFLFIYSIKLLMGK